MKKFKFQKIKIIVFSIILSLFANILSAAEIYNKIGIFDYKHKDTTDALALNYKVVSDKNYNISYFGDLIQIYEFTGLIDKNNFLGENIKREEYAVYFSSGLQKIINLSENVSLVPSFSVGLYDQYDQGKNMGLPLEFKSEVELNFNFLDNSVIGFTYNHISNASLGDKNPGANSYMFNFIKKF